MTKEQAYEAGKDSGQGIGAFIEIYNDYEKYVKAAAESEDNSRQYTHFSFIACEINKDPYGGALWDAYDDGVADGINEAWARRSPDMRQDDIS